MNKNKKRAILSTVLIIISIIIFGTGAVLYFVQRGMWWVFPRHLVKDIHGNCAIDMAICLVVHHIELDNVSQRNKKLVETKRER